jgi:hypothetical protein
MRTWLRLSKLAAVVAVVGSLATTGASTAVAQENGASDRAAGRCGRGVFLDGIRALDISEAGRDEVFIEDNEGVKVWPVTADYVSMAQGQRVEVDKCVSVGTTLYLYDSDAPFGVDYLGSVTIDSERTVNKYFNGPGSRYRLGVIA